MPVAWCWAGAESARGAFPGRQWCLASRIAHACGCAVSGQWVDPVMISTNIISRMAAPVRVFRSEYPGCANDRVGHRQPPFWTDHGRQAGGREGPCSTSVVGADPVFEFLKATQARKGQSAAVQYAADPTLKIARPTSRIALFDTVPVAIVY